MACNNDEQMTDFLWSILPDRLASWDEDYSHEYTADMADDFLYPLYNECIKNRAKISELESERQRAFDRILGYLSVTWDETTTWDELADEVLSALDLKGRRDAQ